jgi:alanyl-tRNA synthetase
MKPLTAAEIRARYLKFFEQNGHKVMASDSLVPPTTRPCCSRARA